MTLLFPLSIYRVLFPSYMNEEYGRESEPAPSKPPQDISRTFEVFRDKHKILRELSWSVFDHHIYWKDRFHKFSSFRHSSYASFWNDHALYYQNRTWNISRQVSYSQKAVVGCTLVFYDDSLIFPKNLIKPYENEILKVSRNNLGQCDLRDAYHPELKEFPQVTQNKIALLRSEYYRSAIIPMHFLESSGVRKFFSRLPDYENVKFGLMTDFNIPWAISLLSALSYSIDSNLVFSASSKGRGHCIDRFLALFPDHRVYLVGSNAPELEYLAQKVVLLSILV